MLKKLNRKFQDYLRSKRLSFGKYIWDRKKIFIIHPKIS